MEGMSVVVNMRWKSILELNCPVFDKSGVGLVDGMPNSCALIHQPLDPQFVNVSRAGT